MLSAVFLILDSLYTRKEVLTDVCNPTLFFSFQVAAAYSYFNLGESSSSSDDEDYSPEDWKKVRHVSLDSVLTLLLSLSVFHFRGILDIKHISIFIANKLHVC